MANESKEWLPIKGAVEKTTSPKEISRNEILEMSPKELVDFFGNLQKNNKLEPFLEKLSGDESLLALFSYWEKWLGEENGRLIDRIVAKKREIYGDLSDSLPLELDKRFGEQDLNLIFSNLGAIQLTFGCSNGCPFCGVDAVPGVREHIPYSRLANLFEKYGKLLGKNEPTLYWASEPSDYASKEGLEDKTYQDAHQLAERYGGYNPHITSKNTKDLKWLDFLGVKGNARVSVYGLGPEMVKGVRETTEGKDVYVVGEGRKHVRGMGVSFAESLEITTGIGCYNGVLLTPRGLYNVVQTHISEKFPQGQIIVPIESLTDEKIRVDDSINNILRKSIIRFSGFRAPPFIQDDILTIAQKDGDYYVRFDEDGTVTDIERMMDKSDLLKTLEEGGIKFGDLINLAMAKYDWTEWGSGAPVAKQIAREIMEKFDFESANYRFSHTKRQAYEDHMQSSALIWELRDFPINDMGNFDIDIGFYCYGDVTKKENIEKPQLMLFFNRVQSTQR